MKDLVTIVIPCKNEEDYIEHLLVNIKNQEDIDNVRIIIADANSTDNTLNIIAKYQMIMNIEVVQGGTVSVGRNIGATLATTPYVLFLDADVRFFSDTVIKDSVKCIHEKNLDLVGLSPKNYGDDIRASILFGLFSLFNKVFAKFTPFAVGAFFLTRRETFNKLGGFPNKYVTSEDYILSAQYNRKKFKILNHYFGQDERRFKKMGYIGMLKYMVVNFINRKNLKHFEKAGVNYWN